ncbi:MAG: prepilin peptidase [Rhizorhabdus sp.]|uniref:prepilin peptidase n=1 Tax=Rhizorhabdus sp. TaxID=1968843 RepID=UPI001B3FC60C|nr:A24 family peptidase [Rhizorhabdus sp.]MBP8232844.1 prepilin peptidase [Rhizorhabdus sp.]
MLTLLGALLGVVFGSFIGVIVTRWPQGRSAAAGRSCCDQCGTPLRAPDLIPLVSYMVRRGRTACCGGRIAPVHVVAEAGGLGIGLLSVLLTASLVHALCAAVMGWLLLALALLDLRHFWLPDRLVAALAVAAALPLAVGLPPSLGDRLIGGVAAWLALMAVRLVYKRLRGREGMGAGDAKLFGALGLWLGWRLLPMLLLLAAMGGLVVALAMAVTRGNVDRSSRLPFGLFLALAAWPIEVLLLSGLWPAGN